MATLTSCGTSVPTAPPDYSEAPPEIQDGFYVENIETITIDLPLEQFLAWLEATALAEILTPTEGMPAVERTVMLEGGDTWGEVGDRRRIELSDGHYAVEKILDSTQNTFMYQVWGFTSPAGRFASYATGEFVYEEQTGASGPQTLVTWTYRFKPNSLTSRIPLSLFVRNSFQGFMENGLTNMKSGAERDQTSGASATP
ncbi:MAG: SRPBCC family protein [Cyanobacteria bacterium J06632_3]